MTLPAVLHHLVGSGLNQNDIMERRLFLNIFLEKKCGSADVPFCKPLLLKLLGRFVFIVPRAPTFLIIAPTFRQLFVCVVARSFSFYELAVVFLLRAREPAATNKILHRQASARSNKKTQLPKPTFVQCMRGSAFSLLTLLAASYSSQVVQHPKAPSSVM